MENVNVAEFGSTEKTTENYSYKLSSPMPFLWTMVLFLVIVGFIAAILFRQAQTAFMHNPGLNGLILGVLGIGIILVFSHVLALRPEVRWFNSFRAAGNADKVNRNPKLLAPMRTLIGSRKASAAGISTTAFRSILDSIATRLDESRDTSRYLIGLLVFLGLLGTFWGLIEHDRLDQRVISRSIPAPTTPPPCLDSLKRGFRAAGRHGHRRSRRRCSASPAR
jgi:hypothetical protein